MVVSIIRQHRADPGLQELRLTLALVEHYFKLSGSGVFGHKKRC